jgi:hypothetical protein
MHQIARADITASVLLEISARSAPSRSRRQIGFRIAQSRRSEALQPNDIV